MPRPLLTAFVLVGFSVATAAAQTAFDDLSPGNQKIAQALCDGQPGGCPATSSPGQQTLTRDQIASMKQHRGWGELFKDMKANGQIPPDVKNLGQLVSGRSQGNSSTSGTAITSGSGRTQVVGKPDVAGKSGKGHLDNDGAMGDQGANAGRGSHVSGHGSGHGHSSGSGAGIGRSGGKR
jgi:hypothetical protein